MNLYFDLEADGLLYGATKIWCIAAKDDRGFRYFFTPDMIDDGIELLLSADLLIGHNICGYDKPLIEKLKGKKKWPKMLDTMLLSQQYEPDRGGHSIEDWGVKFGIEKVQNEDWSQYTEVMRERCIVDVDICEKIHKHFIPEIVSNHNEAIQLEQEVSYVHSQQVLVGCGFNRPAAEALVVRLDAEIADIMQKLDGVVAPTWEQSGVSVSSPFKKDGTYASRVIDWMGDVTSQVWGPFTKVVSVPFNFASDTQVKDLLLANGWKPEEWNYKFENGRKVKTSPKLTEDSYISLGDGVGKDVSHLLVLRHRRSMLTNDNDDTKGWLNRLRDDGRIEADAHTYGTPTARYRHKNIVNVPKVGKVYGEELRSLFGPRDGWDQIGSDAKSLEARMEGHYTFRFDGGEYAKRLLEGDIHSDNAKLWDVIRDVAKNGKYALTYDCFPAKLAATLGKPKNRAQEFYDAFWDGNPALKQLKAMVDMAYKSRGYLIGIDGRYLYSRGGRALLNLLFQSAGSIVVKRATVLAWHRIKDRVGSKANQILHFHDEFQWESDPDYTDLIVPIIKQSWLDAGESLKLNIPIEGDVKVGHNWAECH